MSKAREYIAKEIDDANKQLDWLQDHIIELREILEELEKLQEGEQ